MRAVPVVISIAPELPAEADPDLIDTWPLPAAESALAIDIRPLAVAELDPVLSETEPPVDVDDSGE